MPSTVAIPAFLSSSMLFVCRFLFILSPKEPVGEESVNHAYYVTDNKSDLSRDKVRGCKLCADYDLDHTGAGLRG